MPSQLYHVAAIEEIVETCLFTCAIPKENPVSLLLVGPSGIGKSKMLSRYKSVHFHHTDSITSQGLFDIAIRDQIGNTRFLLIPDINPTLSRKTSTVQATLANLLSFTADGIVRVDDGRGVKDCKHDPIGLISAATDDMYERNAKKWFQLGLRRRVIPVFYKYTTETTQKLQTQTTNDNIHSTSADPIEVKIPPYKPIKIPHHIALKIEVLATKMSISLGKILYYKNGKPNWMHREVVPISPQITLKTLARAHALKRSRTTVIAEDFEFLSRFIDFCDPQHPREI